MPNDKQDQQQARPKFEHVFANLDGSVDGENGGDVSVNVDNEFGDGGDIGFNDIAPEGESQQRQTSADDDEGLAVTFGDEETPPDDETPPDTQRTAPDPRVEALEQEVANLKARDAHAEWQQRLDGADRHIKGQLEEAEKKLRDAKAAYKKAAEEGDTEGEVNAQEAMQDALISKKQWGAEKERVDAARKMAPPQAQPQAQAQPQRLHEETERWLRANPWFSQPEHSARAAAAREIDAQLKKEGLDPTKPNFYREMTNRLSKQFRPIPKQGEPTTRRPPTAATGNGASRTTRQRPGNVKLTSADFNNMERFGLDPRNPAHQAEYAANKRSGDRK